MRVKLYYTSVDRISALVREQWLAELPSAEASRMRRFRHSRERDIRLLGHQLLKQAAASLGCKAFNLSRVRFLAGKKPTSDDLYFSISHSGSRVSCAASLDGPVGLDIEDHRQPVPSPPPFMTDSEKTNIDQHPALFYHYWTCREAVCKAADCGGLAGMSRVHLEDKQARLDGQTWHLYQPDLGKAYSAALAAKVVDLEYEVTRVTVGLLAEQTMQAAMDAAQENNA